MEKYNNNITILRDAGRINDPLKKDEYFALMVTDEHQGQSETRDFFDKSLGWIGLEYYHYKFDRIYISKNYNKRHKSYRGKTLIVCVKDVNQCSVLVN